MFARLLATFCLVQFVSPAAELVVYYTADSGQSPHVIGAMKHELDQLMQTAGYDLTWRDSHDRQPETSAPLVVVHLRGICALPVGGNAPAASEKADSLGATATSDGQMLPFSYVNCGGISRMLASALASEPPMRRDFLYGRAVARVLAHEFYHVLLGDPEHATDGVAKQTFTPMDLVTERFEFEPATLERLQRRKPGVAASDAASGEESGGRN